MKRFNQIFYIFSIVIICNGCNYLDNYEKGNGYIITQKFNIDSFHRVSIGGNFEVLLVKSKTPLVEIETDENLMRYIHVESNKGTLRISQSKNLFSRNKLKAIVHYSELERIMVSGAALVENRGILKSEEIELKLEGAGVVKLNVECNTMDVDLSGAGKVGLSGKTQNQRLKLSGAGGLDAYGLESEVCDIKVSGIGSAEVFVTHELTARLEGLGGIKYIGDPKIINSEISGIGVIEKGTWDLNEIEN
ncbi:head GIN domain-containing protein [Bacteroidota bacterium]